MAILANMLIGTQTAGSIVNLLKKSTNKIALQPVDERHDQIGCTISHIFRTGFYLLKNNVLRTIVTPADAQGFAKLSLGHELPAAFFNKTVIPESAVANPMRDLIRS